MQDDGISMTDLTFVRHGETDWNRIRRFQGQLDVPLNALGQLQAQRVAQALAGSAFDAVLTSDLSRVVATAAPLVARGGWAVQVDACWREQHYGVFEGQDVATLRREQPGLWRQYGEHRADFAPPGGETTRQFYARVHGAVQEVIERHAGRRVLIVTHGGVLDMLWRSVHGLPLDGARACAIPNAGINRLRWQGGRLMIASWAEADHLADLPEQPSTDPLTSAPADPDAIAP
jgi:2,3-bisphosphoglycerate-dependent phosphoglycerate mutase